MTTNTIKRALAFSALLAASYAANAQVPSKLIDPANMDLTVKPGDDFYQYASGNWIKNNPVPAKETRWGSFNQLRDFNINAVKGLVEAAAADQAAASGSVKKRVGDFYAAARVVVERRSAVGAVSRGVAGSDRGSGFPHHHPRCARGYFLG